MSFVSLIYIYILFMAIFLLLNYFIIGNMFYNYGSLMEVECGFESMSNHHKSISFSFMKFLVVFLVFELEIVLLIPLLNLISLISSSFLLVVVLLFIFSSLISEWINSFLSWF